MVKNTLAYSTTASVTKYKTFETILPKFTSDVIKNTLAYYARKTLPRVKALLT